MLMADEGSNYLVQFGGDDFSEDMSLDFETFIHLLSEDPDPLQSKMVDLSSNNASTGEPPFGACNYKNFQLQNDLPHGNCMEDMDAALRNDGILDVNSTEVLRTSENNSCASTGLPFFDSPYSSINVMPTESVVCQSFDIASEITDPCSSMPYCMSMDEQPFLTPSQFYLSSDYNSQPVCKKGDAMIDKMQGGGIPPDSLCSSNSMNLYAHDGMVNKLVSRESASKDLVIDGFSDVKGWNHRSESGHFISSLNENYSFNADDFHIDQTSIKLPMSMGLPSSCEELGDQENTEVMDSIVESSSGFWQSIKEENMFFAPNNAVHTEDLVCGIPSRSSCDSGILNLNITDQYSPSGHSSILSKHALVCFKDGGDNTLIPCKSDPAHREVSPESTHSNLLDKEHLVDDPDICIIEDISHPAPSNRSLVVGNSVVTSQCSRVNGSHSYLGLGNMRQKAKDVERILKVALQDLSQPKSETCPPDGSLEVSLLRHQRIALSWMVQKETSSLHCSGGILADDQGLGKTLSTIALILKERPSFRVCPDSKHDGLETLNLDEDDDMLLKLDGPKKEAFFPQVLPSKVSAECEKTSVQSKGRPAAGTLVVCPTSVLRQWADELHNKVSGKANLSVLVYHGSSRTKDPSELAKYDVVLTTYSIVSMEVPKQALVDEDDDEKQKAEDPALSPMQFSFSKKRKVFSCSDKKSSNKKGTQKETFESVAGPLAKVRWFRVVLDEAQSIKNHRTQVARACWGLRAKRRWCLSGTPIQNAIDDLYSYFRFLRYDPYDAYKSFCSAIKVSINKNPSKGYKKLQAILRTIMLRRTKGTLLDGQPIVTLPPKFVELKKVDFTKEERDFYSKLEADSRAQFEEYAAAGTVKQNYVNILLMLLRLRQACDHPLLVKPYNSKSLWRPSVDMAKQLPQDKQTRLLNSLEASLAICGICNDPPEDAVVSECAHVFCKQCIFEHLSGDDNKCPTAKCKLRLNVSSLFSKSTLSDSLSNQLGGDSSVVCSGTSIVDTVEPFSDMYESSKIKAALEVLMSLGKPKDLSLRTSSDQVTFDGKEAGRNPTDAVCTDMLEEIPACQNLSVDQNSCKPGKIFGEKAIVFSQWTRMLDLLEACLKNSSVQYRRLDGTMSVLARDKAVKDFNNLPEVSVMIMSLKAASLGLNMVAACHVLLLDLWWNPTTEDQAIDRAHRIGQTRPVTVLRLTVRDTVEDRILALQEKKREMVSSAFGEDGAGGRQTRLTVEDLNYLFNMR